ncbi:hypothetical protein BS47DRAFT_793855 [Hydnum rufescens UP504]|uniref:Transmembrane protein n=1 Tax=Hydnum rufescens UP504 TaxID=1448309 RepID=A0A9P6DVI2_9AGAM|nr:hypothetical protein BS47DRAFT_793855 [Hydnum rufescens UP504]
MVFSGHGRLKLKPQHSSWFRSLQFKTWAAGSILAVVGMPLLAWFTRHDPLKCEAFTFLGGSVSGLVITLGSIHVLWVFPGFVNRVKSAGGDPEVVVRLTTFHNLNVTRVIFRFLMLIPLLILAVDGVTAHPHVNESPLWTDLLASLGGIGMVVSSTVTLLIFFPRSIEREAGYKPQLKFSSGKSDEISLEPIDGVSNSHMEVEGHDSSLPQNAPLSPTTKTQSLIEEGTCTKTKRTEVWEMVTPNKNGSSVPHANRIDLNVSPRATLQPPARPQRPNLHPLLMNYSSPINFTEEDCSPPRRLYRPENPV